MTQDTTVIKVFRHCVAAIRDGKLIRRESRQDKEFHFQNWVRARLDETGVHHDVGGRNTYPDFRMVRFTEGYEVKGLAYPGREVNYDCNSQVPSGFHNGRTIFYAFGRYPAEPDGDTYPVLDLVICHGDFLNADHDYVHKNRSIKGFGSYGDIMIRDRKMYVAPSPVWTGHWRRAYTNLDPSQRPMHAQRISQRRPARTARSRAADRRLHVRLAREHNRPPDDPESRRRPRTRVHRLARLPRIA